MRVVIDFARNIRGEYLTGTTIAVIAALLFLLMPSAGQFIVSFRQACLT